MSDKTRVLVGRSMAAVGIVSALAGWVWIVAIGQAALLVPEWLMLNGLLAIGTGLIAWIVLPSQPRNGAILPFVIVATTSGLFCLAFAGAMHFARDNGLDLEAFYASTPSDLPTLAALLLMMGSWLFIPFSLLLTVALVLFPDGRPPSPRWRWTVWASYGSIAVQSVVVAWLFRPSGTVPYKDAESSADFVQDLGPVVAFAEVASLAMIPVCVGGMILRFRRSSGVERRQLRLVVWGTGVAGALALLSVVGDLLEVADPHWPALLMVSVFVGSYGVAIAKYRLYDVDVVISKTLVYGSLAVFITAVYVGIVVGASVLFGAQDEFWLGVVATVVIAIAFQPLRRWLQRFANRIVYGRRSTPYEVLSAFSQGVAAVDPEVLGQVAQSLTQGTTATAASIWVERNDQFHPIAAFPEGPLEHGMRNGDRLEDITHDGERLGIISLTLPPAQPFPPTDEALLEQVSAGLGLALRNLQLTGDLQTRVDQLRESRRRIVAVQDQTRQMLERDLHDGAQQRLVALKIKIGISESMAQKQGLDDVSQILTTVKEETDLTIDSLRTLARGIYPPLLEAEGLGPALTTQLHRAQMPITVQAAGVERHPREIEATVYFCVLEAVQNSIKHAQAQSVLVSVSDTNGHLIFEIRDDGVGFDHDEAHEGHGLINILDRLDAVEGSLEIESDPGHGTVVRGTVPVPEVASV